MKRSAIQYKTPPIPLTQPHSKRFRSFNAVERSARKNVDPFKTGSVTERRDAGYLIGPESRRRLYRITIAKDADPTSEGRALLRSKMVHTPPTTSAGYPTEEMTVRFKNEVEDVRLSDKRRNPFHTGSAHAQQRYGNTLAARGQMTDLYPSNGSVGVGTYAAPSIHENDFQ